MADPNSDREVERRTQYESEKRTDVDRKRKPTRTERSTLLNALIGAVVSVVTAFLPFSPVLGGAVAGYLERTDGVRVGALSGVFATIPVALIVFLAAGLFFIVPDPLAAGGLFLLVALAVLFVALYTVGLSALGGVLGVYIRREFAK